MKVRRPVVIRGDIAIVPLTKGYEAIIDAADAADIGRFNWTAAVRGKKVYAARSIWASGGCELMHRRILGEPDNGVDHRDGDGLNNRRSNLRPATKSENAMNTAAHDDNKSGFKGVTYHKPRKKWAASICRNGQRKYLGLHPTAEAAHKAYVKAAKEYHGKFARFN